MNTSGLHSNTRRLIQIMNGLDWKKWWNIHPREDFGQAVRRMSEEDGNEEGEHPSDAAINIALRLSEKYKKER